MKVLALIPARGGSKGLPHKNVKLLCNKPMVAYSIQEALKSSYIDRVVVSTEDREIAIISKELGAEIPFMRPSELALDETPSMDVFVNMIDELLKREGYYPDIVTILEPTSPLRRVDHIDATIEKLIQKKPDSVVTVCPVERKPSNIVRVVDTDRILRYIEKPDDDFCRRQDWNNLRRINSAVYTMWTDLIYKERKLVGDKCLMVEMHEDESVNVDSFVDFKLAEILLHKLQDIDQF